jgi:hypothetical protein
MRQVGVVVIVWLVACGGDKVRHLPDGPDVSICEATGCNLAASDGCCPPTCNAASDLDCIASCGNSVIEPQETCDPQSSCPTACPQIGCQLRTLDQPDTCGAKCINGDLQAACLAQSDGCCPTGCTANNDIDCAATCDNGVIETGEQCDPLATCPTSCPQQACQIYELFDSGTCGAQCVAGGQQTACVNGDGCCPGGCNANTDSDCMPTCNNGIVEAGETCDPLASCPTSCAANGCQLYAVASAGTCQAACAPSSQETACVDNDACCPGSCSSNNDNDCTAICGNGVVEAGETCDGNCPTCNESFTCYTSIGSAATCDVQCHQPVTTCGIGGDQCCAFDGNGCGAVNDRECTGPKWQYLRWNRDTTYTTGVCDVIRVYNIKRDGSYLFTTCSPEGTLPAASGDPVIKKVVDNAGTIYNVANDDCGDPTALPNLAGWSCKDPGGILMSCASPSPGGFIVTNPSSFIYLDVTVCAGAASGSAPFFIWYNAPEAPGPG